MLKAGTAVIALQGGVEAEERLAQVIEAEHLVSGVAEVSADIDAPGRIRLLSDYAPRGISIAANNIAMN